VMALGSLPCCTELEPSMVVRTRTSQQHRSDGSSSLAYAKNSSHHAIEWSGWIAETTRKEGYKCIHHVTIHLWNYRCPVFAMIMFCVYNNRTRNWYIWCIQSINYMFAIGKGCKKSY
jgi:hypothetical protein